ncbi:hypothetical protein KVT40_006920 [Elsinoe batatas]|uniref:GST N-terminal domain-containing protein n=1 Tax=Elsinoe batatas TaxID=2601811 RepID=A0A8K0PH30_9PEZI|nr:hypothetical protein KVT40_006920 [Elsinoe batatas]
MAPEMPNDIILFHYPFSPYARRIVWYLTLRNIPYAQCLQPPTLPRPTLSSLGVSYRRIPLLSINSSIYLDTRLILSTLERLFPPSATHPPLSPQASTLLAPLLSSFTIEGGVFARSAQLIPPSLPLLNDPKFTKDRQDFMGRSWAKEHILRARPEAIASMRNLWDVYETTLSDGREWIAGTDGVTLADIEGVWPLVWLGELKALDKGLFGEEVYPRTHAWVKRFKTAIAEAEKKHPKAAKAVKVDGEGAVGFILGKAGRVQQGEVQNDPLELKKGEEVAVWPIDTGFNHKDKGRLVGLTKDEVVIAVTTKVDPSKEIEVHAPRWGFRIAKVGGQTKL